MPFAFLRSAPIYPPVIATVTVLFLFMTVFYYSGEISYAFAQVRFDSPQGVAVDLGGNVYVADTNNDRVQKFKTDGTFIKSWGSLCDIDTGNGCEDPDGIGPLSKGDGHFDRGGRLDLQALTL